MESESFSHHISRRFNAELEHEKNRATAERAKKAIDRY